MVNFLFYKEFLFIFTEEFLCSHQRETFRQNTESAPCLPALLPSPFPFYIKECGFCSERKFVPGKQYSYNDYLLLYSIDGTAPLYKNQNYSLYPAAFCSHVRM